MPIDEMPNPLAVLVANTEDSNIRTRLSQFVAWQQERGPWYQPDLAGYRDYLLSRGLSPRSVASYLATIRGVYQRLVLDEKLTDDIGHHTSLSMQTMLGFIHHSTRPELSSIDEPIIPQAPRIHLSTEQAEYLLTRPGIDTLAGKRDTAILAFLVCLGIREDELCTIEVDDLYYTTSGELALLVHLGDKGKQRLIPYGKLDWCLALTELWLSAADITDGPVFRGFYARGGIRPDAVTTRTIQRIVGQYLIDLDGKELSVSPDELRRTYAYLKLRADLDAVLVGQYLDIHGIRVRLRY